MVGLGTIFIAIMLVAAFCYGVENYFAPLDASGFYCLPCPFPNRQQADG